MAEEAVRVGTGGEDLDTVAADSGSYSNPNVITAQDQAFGVLKLDLNRHGYAWSYKPVLAGPGFDASALNFSDAGQGRCRGTERMCPPARAAEGTVRASMNRAIVPPCTGGSNVGHGLTTIDEG